MDRRDFQELARLRVREATALMKLRLPDGAYYLAGYALECALKACIAKRTRRHEFPDKKRVEASYSHNLAQLVNEAGLRSVFSRRPDKIQVSAITGTSYNCGRNKAATRRILWARSKRCCVRSLTATMEFLHV
jgi:hypothetical protein